MPRIFSDSGLTSLKCSFNLLQKLVVRPNMSEKEEVEQSPRKEEATVPSEAVDGSAVAAAEAPHAAPAQDNTDEQTSRDDDAEENRVSDQEISGSLIPATGETK